MVVEAWPHITLLRDSSCYNFTEYSENLTDNLAWLPIIKFVERFTINIFYGLK